MSSRAEHYRRAEDILRPVDHRLDEGGGPGPEAGWRTMLAQVHATLAVADPGVEMEATASGPVLGGTRQEPTVFGLSLDQVAELVDLREKLEAALAELERQGRKPTTSMEVAIFIRRSVQEEGR